MNWSHGYNVSSGYTFGFYREMAPDWLNYAALLNGYRVPDTTAPFRYLELGCGQGFGLCLLAATYPRAEFVGVDFNPEHVAHARELASLSGLPNLRFEEADFSQLAQHWPGDFGQFHYAALHGIYSWVSAELRPAIIRCLAAATVPGALVYLSYNTLPGWTSAMPLQHLLQRLQLQSARPGPQILQQGAELFDALIKAKAGVSTSLATLQSRVDSLRSQNTAYLVQEYLHENWHPLWFSQVADEVAAAKLSHVGSATLAENYLPQFLSRELAEIVRSGEGRVMQQALIDLAINQSFRRDVFCRGPRETRRSMLLLDQYTLLAGRSLSQQVGEVATSFGNLTLTQSLLDAVVDRLMQGPARIADLIALEAFRGKPRQDVIQIVTLLLQAGHLHLGIDQASDASIARFNQAVSSAVITDFAAYGSLAAQHTPTAVPATDIEMALYGSHVAAGAPPDVERLASDLLGQLRASGRTLIRDGRTLETEPEQQAEAKRLVAEFIGRTLPSWQRLGVL